MFLRRLPYYKVAFVDAQDADQNRTKKAIRKHGRRPRLCCYRRKHLANFEIRSAGNSGQLHYESRLNAGLTSDVH